jgi:hypothetical protein
MVSLDLFFLLVQLTEILFDVHLVSPFEFVVSNRLESVWACGAWFEMRVPVSSQSLDDP